MLFSAVQEELIRLCMMNNWIGAWLYCHAFSQHSVLAFQHCIFMPVHVHGRLARSDQALSRVLLAGRRHGDVTIWYQSIGLQQWASMGQGYAVTEGRITFSVQQNSSEPMNWENLSKSYQWKKRKTVKNSKLGNFCEQSEDREKFPVRRCRRSHEVPVHCCGRFHEVPVRCCGRVDKVYHPLFRAAKRSRSRS